MWNCEYLLSLQESEWYMHMLCFIVDSPFLLLASARASVIWLEEGPLGFRVKSALKAETKLRNCNFQYTGKIFLWRIHTVYLSRYTREIEQMHLLQFDLAWFRDLNFTLRHLRCPNRKLKVARHIFTSENCTRGISHSIQIIPQR